MNAQRGLISLCERIGQWELRIKFHPDSILKVWKVDLRRAISSVIYQLDFSVYVYINYGMLECKNAKMYLEIFLDIQI